MLGMEVKGHIEAGIENLLFSGDFNNVVRVACFRTNTNITQGNTSGANLTTTVLPVGDPVTALFDLDDVSEVYFDDTYDVQVQYGPNSTGSGTATQTSYAKDFRKSVRFNPPVDVTFFDSTNASVESPGVILACWSDSTVTPNPSMSASFRIFFEDA